MRQPAGPERRLILLSNRLPFVVQRDAQGGTTVEPGAGGLVTALAPVLRDRGGTWIGWSGALDEENLDLPRMLRGAARASGYSLEPIQLTARERTFFYHGFANEIVWPLFHDLQSRCRFESGYWESYRDVTRKYAAAAAGLTRHGDLIWVHDYHLMSVGRELREMGVHNRLGFFLHIPFPPLDIFLKLPWRFPILRDLLTYDLIGFQTLRDRRNFVQCVRRLGEGAVVRGKGQVTRLRGAGCETRLGVFPIGIDFREFAHRASAPEVTAAAASVAAHHHGGCLLLGVDRLDYTKGIPEKLLAFREALRRNPDMLGRVTLVQVVVPSRGEIPQYSDLLGEIEQLVGRINGEFTRAGWLPVHYMYRSLLQPELLSYYRAADVLLTTPCKDGMNLVAKEYCACQLQERGVLILSEFAGAAAQLQRGALLANPYDTEGMAEAIRIACAMPEAERRKRMHRMRLVIRRQDVFWWVNGFLEAWSGGRLDNFPVQDDYMPEAPA